MIIDFHTHTFPDSICDTVIAKLSKASASAPFTNGSQAALLDSMAKSGVAYSVTLPVMTNPGQVEKINHLLAENFEANLEKGLIPFGGMHPEYENYKEELKFLKNAGIKGIKLHPAYQNMDLDDPRILRILDAAAEQDLIVLIHAGIDIGIYDHNYASTKQILQVLKEIGDFKFVLAHMGGWGCWEEVERDLAGAPVYLDTAFSLGSITPSPYTDRKPILERNLNKQEFLSLIKKHGEDKILFATDSPWEDQADYIARITDYVEDETTREKILGKNAQELLKF